MRIAIDIRKINEFGVGTYIWNLVRNLAGIDTQNQYLLIGSNRNFHELGPLPGNFKQLYQPDDLQRGFLSGLDRHGMLRRFGLLSISIGVVTTERRSFGSATELAQVAVEDAAGAAPL